MSDCCVIVADAARARLFTMEPASNPRLESSPKLFEQKSLVNPEAELPEREVMKKTRGGRQGSRGAGIHTFDDHRSRHMETLERRFARVVAGEARKVARACKAKNLVLVASQRMLGFLRAELGGNGSGKLDIRDLASDIARKTPAQIQAHLAKAGLVAACASPSQRNRPL